MLSSFRIRCSELFPSFRWNQDVANLRFGLAIATALDLVLLAIV